jgi:hypothetical protein
MSRRATVVVAALFGGSYAVAMSLRGDVLPGLVTGVLGAVLIYVVVGRVQQHNDAVRRRRDKF